MRNILRLLKSQRICQDSWFKQILKNNQQIVGRFCVLYYRKNQLVMSRLGIIASKRAIRLAVIRNQFKRLVRENFRQQLTDELISCDVVIIARKSASVARKQDITICLDNLFRQLKQHYSDSSCVVL